MVKLNFASIFKLYKSCKNQESITIDTHSFKQLKCNTIVVKKPYKIGCCLAGFLIDNTQFCGDCETMHLINVMRDKNKYSCTWKQYCVKKVR